MFQLFASLVGVVTLASVVLAQNVYISHPPTNSSVDPGFDMTVKLNKPMSLTGSEDIAVVIGVFPCTSAPECPDVTEVMGDVLYSGPYDAKLYKDDYDPYQNFTVVLPSWYHGPVQLGVAHFFLLGAGSSAELQFASATLNVVASGDSD